MMPSSGRYRVLFADVCRCLPLITNSDGDSCVEDLLDTILLFTTALHVHGAHLLGDCTALLGCHWCETLRLQKLDAVFLVSKVGLKTKKHEWCCGAEVEDFGVPLGQVSACN